MRVLSKHFGAGQLLLGTLVLGAAFAFSHQAQAEVASAPIPRGVPLKSWQDNGRDGRYLLQLIKGKAPKAGRQVVGTVTSDTDCDADAQGLSHCHNTIKLADGSEITVIDSHNMHLNRCLGGGDQLTLTAVGKSWIMGTMAPK